MHTLKLIIKSSQEFNSTAINQIASFILFHSPNTSAFKIARGVIRSIERIIKLSSRYEFTVDKTIYYHTFIIIPRLWAFNCTDKLLPRHFKYRILSHYCHWSAHCFYVFDTKESMSNFWWKPQMGMTKQHSKRVSWFSTLVEGIRNTENINTPYSVVS